MVSRDKDETNRRVYQHTLLIAFYRRVMSTQAANERFLCGYYNRVIVFLQRICRSLSPIWCMPGVSFCVRVPYTETDRYIYSSLT